MNYEDRVTKEYVENALGSCARMVMGSWVGDGTSSRTIELPVEPKLVIVLGHYNYYSTVRGFFGMLAQGYNRCIYVYGEDTEISNSTSFYLSGSSIRIASMNYCNVLNQPVYYFAFY